MLPTAGTTRAPRAFTSGVSHLTRLSSIEFGNVGVCSSALRGWSSLQSLKELNISGLSYHWPDAVTTELSFLSRLTNLSRLHCNPRSTPYANRIRVGCLGNVLEYLPSLPKLQCLSVLCCHEHEFDSLARITSLTELMLTIDIAMVEPQEWQSMASLTRLHRLALTINGEGASVVEYLMRLPHVVPQVRNLFTSATISDANVGPVFEAVSRLGHLAEWMLFHKVNLAGLRHLHKFRALKKLTFWMTQHHFTEEDCQAISRAPALEKLHLGIKDVPSQALRWFRHMPAIRHVEANFGFLDGRNDVLPKEFVLGRQLVRDADEDV